MTGETRTGFIYTVDDDMMDDFEFLERIRELEKSPTAVPDFIKYVLGEDQTNALKEHCRGENGRVSSKLMQEELSDILNGNKDVKK